MYKIYFTHKSEKELTRIASIDSQRVLEKIPLLSSPFSHNLDIKKLTNELDFYRVRVGKVRIIFEIDHKMKEIWIRKVGYRGGVYR